MLAQLEKQFLRANLGKMRALFAETDQADEPLIYFQFQQQIEELETRLAEMPRVIDQAPAGVALFVGGAPMLGSHGIKADFGGKLIESFQKIVSQRFAAAETGPLGARGA